MRGMQVAEDDFFRFELLLKFDCIRFRTGHDTEGRSVVGRDLKRRGKNFRDGIGAGVHRHHGTARQFCIKRPRRAMRPERPGDPHAGESGGDKFSDAVSGHGGWLDTQLCQKRQCVFDYEIEAG